MENADYEKARKRVTEKKKFYKEALSWLSVCIMLFTINILTSPRFFWCIFPIGFGSIGLIMKFFKLHGGSCLDNWEEKEIEREVKKINRKGKRINPVDLPEDELDLEEVPRPIKTWNDKDFV